ncbi:hypothetical protein SUGI_0939640 [Cryptomeria japonica]|uniref:uncharacterized protein LOC131075953 n=1 Tax=Cryptomeria japonica TaxID=3369 RepID=UPI0024148280|nr:uncharacterized protein LOC131075953 [Cryptomeria japonica]GLJ44692.1 hypothetical protein SUGI_0939640 [Cryptomeria japonica]
MAQEISYNELLDSVLERMAEIDPNFSVDATRTSVESDENLRSILIGEEIDTRQWIEVMAKDLTSNHKCQGDCKLRTSYNLHDLFVKKKTVERELRLQSQQATTKFTVISSDERKRMSSKGYEYIHLDGVEITCCSNLPPGSDGFVLAAVYDLRHIKAKEGFLGLMAFPLGLRKSSAVIRTNYCISIQDSINWAVLICEHGLKDKFRPYTIRMKSVHKYVRNIGKFTFASDSENEQIFHIPIEASKNVQVIEAVKQTLCKTSTRLLMDNIFNASDREKKMSFEKS